MSGILAAITSTFAQSANRPSGSIILNTVGTYTWQVPAGVNLISAVAVGGGGAGGFSCCGGCSAASYGTGGGGGALAYVNDISVTPNQMLSVTVGAGGVTNINQGGASYLGTLSAPLVKANGGGNGNNLGSSIGGVGGTISVGTGGSGGSGGNFSGSGAGGAGGYAGNGGSGIIVINSAQSGTGGGGGAGTAFSAGGGVGLGGQGANGVGGNLTASQQNQGKTGSPSTLVNGGSANPSYITGSAGGIYGGGGAPDSSGYIKGGNGGQGAIRIVWGANRAFPATNVSAV